MVRVSVTLWLFITLILVYSFGLTPEIVQEQVLFEGGGSDGEVQVYRIPVATLTPQGKIVVYSEGRKYSRSDDYEKFIAGKTSVDGGYSWTPIEILVGNLATADGLNLGVTLYNSEQKELLVIYTECIHKKCKNRLTSHYLLKSHDDGVSWEPPIDIGFTNGVPNDLYNTSFGFGPGYGIQKKLEPHKGRLIVCGHTDPVAGYYRAMECVISDDQGTSWKRGLSLPSLPKYGLMGGAAFYPSEVQITEMKNGSVMLNVRNENKYECACRIVLRSDDGCETPNYGSIYFDRTLVDPVCAGSILVHGDYLFFSNAAHGSHRENITVRWSSDEGKTWDGALNIYEKAAAYSTLTSVDENHVAVIYERGASAGSDAGNIMFTLIKIK